MIQDNEKKNIHKANTTTNINNTNNHYINTREYYQKQVSNNNKTNKEVTNIQPEYSNSQKNLKQITNNNNNINDNLMKYNTMQEKIVIHHDHPNLKDGTINKLINIYNKQFKTRNTKKY